jgi:predicted dehydrogenase
VSFTLRFPSGTIANCLTSYGARDDKRQRLNFATAVADMPNAYLYKGQQLVITRRDGDATSEARLSLQAPNQFAAEIDHMAACIIEGKAPRTPGEEGLRDHVLMEAIYRSAATGALVRV